MHWISYSFPLLSTARLKLVRETRAGQLVKGIIVLLVVWGLSKLFKLVMMETLMMYLFQYSLILLMIVFQPEIRRALEQIGRSGAGKKGWFSGGLSDDTLRLTRRAINAVVDAASLMSKQKTGALMVFEMKTKLGDIIDTGTIVNAIPSAPDHLQYLLQQSAAARRSDDSAGRYGLCGGVHPAADEERPGCH